MFKVFLSEIKYIFKSKWRIASIVLILLLPFSFAFLQISANWNPFNGSQNLKIAVLNLDSNNLVSNQTAKGIIKSGQEIKFNGTNQKYSLNMQSIYGYTQQQAEELAKSNQYDAVYVIPSGYGENQITGPSNFIINLFKNLEKDLTSPDPHVPYFISHPIANKIVMDGIVNFINNMVNDPILNQPVKTGEANDVQTLFYLFGVLIHNSLYSVANGTEATAKYNSVGVTTDQLKAIDNAIRKMKFSSGGTVSNIIPDNNKEITVSDLVNDGFTKYRDKLLVEPQNFFVNFHWNEITNQLLDGIFTSALQNGDIKVPNFIAPNYKVQLYIGNRNSQLTSELLNLLSNSTSFYKNIYNQESVQYIANQIHENVKQEARNTIKIILTNCVNFIEGYTDTTRIHQKGIAEILYPSDGSILNPIALALVKNILNPLKDTALPNLYTSLDTSLDQLIANNLKYFVLPNSSFITSVVIGNKNYTFGQAIAPNLIAIGLWLGILSLVFMMKNKRIRGEEKVNTTANFFGKAMLWVSVGLVQGIIMISALLILGVSPNHVWSLFTFTLITAIVLGLIAHGISSISRGGEIGIGLLIFLAITQLSISYGVFPTELQNNLLNWISYLSPTRYIINGYQNIMNDYGWVNLAKTTLPILAFLLFVPASYFVNYCFDRISFNKYGNYKDFVIELEEE